MLGFQKGENKERVYRIAKSFCWKSCYNLLHHGFVPQNWLGRALEIWYFCLKVHFKVSNLLNLAKYFPRRIFSVVDQRLGPNWPARDQLRQQLASAAFLPSNNQRWQNWAISWRPTIWYKISNTNYYRKRQLLRTKLLLDLLLITWLQAFFQLSRQITRRPSFLQQPIRPNCFPHWESHHHRHHLQNEKLCLYTILQKAP